MPAPSSPAAPGGRAVRSARAAPQGQTVGPGGPGCKPQPFPDRIEVLKAPLVCSEIGSRPKSDGGEPLPTTLMAPIVLVEERGRYSGLGETGSCRECGRLKLPLGSSQVPPQGASSPSAPYTSHICPHTQVLPSLLESEASAPHGLCSPGLPPQGEAYKIPQSRPWLPTRGRMPPPGRSSPALRDLGTDMVLSRDNAHRCSRIPCQAGAPSPGGCVGEHHPHRKAERGLCARLPTSKFGGTCACYCEHQRSHVSTGGWGGTPGLVMGSNM